jgi:hypothetical protein
MEADTTPLKIRGKGAAMSKQSLDEAYAAELILRADDLQDEANELVADLGLSMMLERAGQAEQIGSSAMGLMVVRDVDFQVIAPGLSTDRAFATMRPLLARTQVFESHYANECGQHNPKKRPEDDRYYFVVRYQTDASREWRITVSFWVRDTPSGQRARTQRIVGQLDGEKRLAILWIKDVWRHLPTYPSEVSAADVEDAVLEEDVRTPDQFATYLVQRGKPMR